MVLKPRTADIREYLLHGGVLCCCVNLRSLITYFKTENNIYGISPAVPNPWRFTRDPYRKHRKVILRDHTYGY